MQGVSINCISNGDGVGRVDGGERSKSPGCIDDGQEHIRSVIRNEGGGVVCIEPCQWW